MLSLVGHWQPLANGVIPSPIANSLDLSSPAECPNRCYFCNVRWSDKSGKGHMDDGTFAHVLNVYRRHNVRSACISGGGESLANPRCEDYFREIVKAGTQIGIITNGRIYREIPRECRFINVSVNAVDPPSYGRMSGVEPECFGQVIENITRWVGEGHYVTYKVMITDRNKNRALLQRAVAKASQLACRAVLFRFATAPWDRVGNPTADYVRLTDVEAELFQAEIGILRKHYPDLDIQMPLERYDRSSRKYTPKRCSGTVVNFVTLYNGDVILCSDFRSCERMRLCHISEFDQFWGGEKHKNIIAAVNPGDCPRCSFLMHDTILDQFVYNDPSNQFFI